MNFPGMNYSRILLNAFTFKSISKRSYKIYIMIDIFNIVLYIMCALKIRFYLK